MTFHEVPVDCPRDIEKSISDRREEANLAAKMKKKEQKKEGVIAYAQLDSQ